MTPRLSLLFAGLFASTISAGFAWFVRMPLPFPGFAAVAAAGLSFLGTLTTLAAMPRNWVWSETEVLRQAFQARHGVSAHSAENALDAITKTHARARKLRHAAEAMRDDVAQRTLVIADRLDAGAREIFYDPERHRDLRAVLIRSELIENAAVAHAQLRRRKRAQTEDASRQKFLLALEALDAAFDETELLAARGLLAEVAVASEVAETLLKPRGTFHAPISNKPSQGE